MMVISGASGSNPEGMTVKNAIVGCLTMFVITGLGLLILWVIVKIANKVK